MCGYSKDDFMECLEISSSVYSWRFAERKADLGCEREYKLFKSTPDL